LFLIVIVLNILLLSLEIVKLALGTFNFKPPKSESNCKKMIFFFLIFQVRAIIEINKENVLNTIAIEHPFVCFTLDWWPDSKVSFGNASWIGTGLNNLDLEHPKLIQAARTLASSQ